MLRSLFTRSRRYVLIIGNAGAVLSYIVSGQVHARWSVSSADAESLRTIAEALNKRRGAPLTVLFDILEQSYRREAIPPVGVMDRSKVLKRRLTIAYPNFDIKAALALDEKVGPMAPFGGFKQSGFGRDLGREALDGYTESKTIWVGL